MRKKISLGLLLLSSYTIAQKELENGDGEKVLITEKKKTVAVKKSVPVVKKEKKTKKKEATKKKVDDHAIASQNVITVVENPRTLHNKIVFRIPTVGIDGVKDILITERMLHTKSL